MAKKASKKAIKVPVTPKGELVLDRGVIAGKRGHILPGETFSEDEISPERLAELRKKGLIRGVMSTEEKGTIKK